MQTFPYGAKVYVDGRDLAIVKQVFLNGSSSFMFPHYKVDFIDGDKNVVVAIKRVGIEQHAVPGTGQACGAANDCTRLEGHKGDHCNIYKGNRWKNWKG